MTYLTSIIGSLFLVIWCVFCVYKREIQKEFLLNCLAKITLPKSVANQLGNVFVPNGSFSFEKLRISHAIP